MSLFLPPFTPVRQRQLQICFLDHPLELTHHLQCCLQYLTLSTNVNFDVIHKHFQLQPWEHYEDLAHRILHHNPRERNRPYQASHVCLQRIRHTAFEKHPSLVLKVPAQHPKNSLREAEVHCRSPHHFLSCTFSKACSITHNHGNRSSVHLFYVVIVLLHFQWSTRLFFLLLHCFLLWHPTLLCFFSLSLLNHWCSQQLPTPNGSKQQSSWSLALDILWNEKKENCAGLNWAVAALLHS